MKRLGYMPAFVGVVFVSVSAVQGAEASAARLMPEPAEAHLAEAIRIPGRAVIMLSSQAGEPERYAAKLLARQIKRRFGWEWSVTTEAAPAAGLRVLLGVAGTFPALDQALAAAGLAVPEPMDGYALSVSAGSEGTVTAALSGRNGRGVLFGQDTLFQLVERLDGGEPAMRAAAIRDWPTIPMRGRPHPHFEVFLKPAHWDALLLSRLNFIDLRDSIYAFEPGARFNREEMSKVIAEARRRDMIIFTAVNCGVPAAQHEAVLGTFKEFLDLGANAIWLSFDDKGPGEAPRQIVTRVLELGRQRGISGDRVAITPPKGSYQVVDTKFNREVAGIPGMQHALWYWTNVPCAQDVADARAIGLATLPSWWHNWPRFRDGSFASGAGRAYMPVIGMDEGWNHPRDDELREAGKYVYAVLPWDGWQAQQHYLLPAIGWWSWRPERYDFRALRTRVYDVVFGTSEPAMAFDDGLNALIRRFLFSVSHTQWAALCPPRLRSLDDRAEVTRQAGQMQADLAKIKASSAASLLDAELLRNEYLEPMEREVRAVLAAAQAPYPEYWWDAHQAAVLNAVHDRDMARADGLIAAARPRVMSDLAEVERLMSGARGTGEYAAWWKKRAEMKSGDWARLIEARRAELLERVADYGRNILPFDTAMRNLNDPPIQFGTGAWRRRNRVLATVWPEDRETFGSNWVGGVIEKNKIRVACFAVDRHVMINEGGYSELPVNVPLSGRRDRLALLLYLADTNKESFGFGYAKWRWSGSRAIRLLWKDREIWKADLGITRPTGEWIIVHLPALPADLKTLPLRLRVEDYESAKNNLEIVYLGPIRLLELDRE
ncbi:MAG: hypothetical protein HRF43_20440 [Phycisphaerae bacterium]|jgi:hypothetical protein